MWNVIVVMASDHWLVRTKTLHLHQGASLLGKPNNGILIWNSTTDSARNMDQMDSIFDTTHGREMRHRVRLLLATGLHEGYDSPEYCVVVHFQLRHEKGQVCQAVMIHLPSFRSLKNTVTPFDNSSFKTVKCWWERGTYMPEPGGKKAFPPLMS